MRYLLVLCGLMVPVAPVAAQDILAGDNSGPYAHDGECDDRRYRGASMASVLSWSHVGRDAADCHIAYLAGDLQIWDPAEAILGLKCDSVDFGTDSGSLAGDGECDDPRFEGFGVANGVGPEGLMTDATDCRRLCEAGAIGLRDY